MFVVIPQFIVTGISAVIFAIFEPPPSLNPSTPVGVGAGVGIPVSRPSPIAIGGGNGTVPSGLSETRSAVVSGDKSVDGFDSIALMFQ